MNFDLKNKLAIYSAIEFNSIFPRISMIFEEIFDEDASKAN